MALESLLVFARATVQSRMLSSKEADASVFPSVEKATWRQHWWWGHASSTLAAGVA